MASTVRRARPETIAATVARMGVTVGVPGGFRHVPEHPFL